MEPHSATAFVGGKDDNSTFGYICYWILLFLFFVLDLLAIVNFKDAYKLGRLKSTSILTFYVSVLTVVTIRVVLFSDVFADYPFQLYVICLITMPTFLYLITGLSLVLCNTELLVMFKNMQINQKHGSMDNQK